MKSLHRIIFAAAVLPAASLSAFAQTPSFDQVHINTYVESFNYETMTGTVAIESFVENNIVDPDVVVKPYDIVLVLDISGSMEEGVGIPKYIAQSSTGYTYKGFPDKNSPYYVYYNGEYYNVVKYEVKIDKTKYLSLRFSTDGGSTYLYLTGTGISTTMPTTITDDKATLWTGVLYKQGEANRLDVMKSAAELFVDMIGEKSSATVDNRIAIQAFDASAHDICGLLDVQSSASTLKSNLSGLSIGSGTATGTGMLAAQDIIDGLSATELSDREQVIILFTDGEADGNTEKSKAINASYYMKNEKGVTVYSIGFTGMSSFIEYVSSNYPSVQATISGSNILYSGTTQESDEYYLETSDGSDLEDIFAIIANKLDMAMLTFDTDTEVECEISSTLTLDIPGGSSDIKAYTANCTGVSGGVFSFGTQIPFDDLTVTVNSNGITTEGFDYTGNWCGEKDSAVHGKELIVKIPFKFTPTALTDKLEKIFADGKAPALSKDEEAYALASAPAAPEFVELIISKTGLLKGESAIFEIVRSPLGTETADVPVNRIVLTGTSDMGTAVSHKVYFLNPDATYNVIEHTDWSWTYKPSETPQTNGFIKQSKDMTTVPDGDTATLNFTNTKYDSSKLTNNAEAIK